MKKNTKKDYKIIAIYLPTADLIEIFAKMHKVSLVSAAQELVESGYKKILKLREDQDLQEPREIVTERNQGNKIVYVPKVPKLAEVDERTKESKKMFSEGKTLREIARKFGVNARTIRRDLERKVD